MEVRLRQLEEEDLAQLRDWRNDDRLRHGFREYRLLNMANQRDWFSHISRSREVEMFGIELEVISKIPTRKLVGVCGLCNINWVNRAAEVSLYIVPERPGVSELALELLRQKAFEEFGLRRLWAEVYDFRAVSIARLERCGYVLEGRMREHVFKQGKYHDSLIYGLLREEE